MERMDPSPRLLLAYDDSPEAGNAVDVAAALFPSARADVLTVHPEPFTVDRVRASAGGIVPASITVAGLEQLDREMLRSATERAALGAQRAAQAGLRDPQAVTSGDPVAWRGIVAHADAIDAEVIVCGGRGLGPVARAVLGSVSETLLFEARRPVLVVPDGAAAGPGPIVLGYDGSADAQAAIATAARLLPGRAAVVVHAWEPLQTMPGLDLVPIDAVREMTRDLEAIAADEAAALAAEGVRRATEAGLDAAGISPRGGGNAWHAVAQAAEDHAAAVVVAGSRGQGRITSLMLGSVSSGLVRNARRPTLIVR
jgi:nucleotide-binding universal stress UspA family protein